MSESTESPKEFTSKVPPPSNVEYWLPKDKILTPEEKSQVKQETVDASVVDAQQRVVDGLSKIMTDYQVENMKNLAPQDKFTIGGQDYDRKKITPKVMRELREAERQYIADIKQITDPDLKQDRDWQLLQFKAERYFGMTKEQFEDTDVEKLQTIIQATELRSQGFRLYK